MNLKQLLLSILLIGSIFGCQSDQRSQDQRTNLILNGQFYLRYLQTEKELKAEVTFNSLSESGQSTPVELSQISFQGEAMKIRRFSNPAKMIRYDYRGYGPYQKSYQVAFQHEELGQQTKELSMVPIRGFNFNKPIKKSEGFDFSWEGARLDQDQSLLLLFTTQENQSFNLAVQGPTENTSITVTSEALTGLSTGNNQLTIIQKQLQTERKSAFRYVREMEFYHDAIELQVEE